jgi:hypothetical protein
VSSRALPLALALCLAAHGTAAQGTLGAQALVVTPGMLVTALRDLAFGGVPLGLATAIAFGTAAARWRRASDDPTSGVAFNPAVGATGRFGPAPNPTLHIWLGGTVSPAAAQLPGIYTGTVVVQLAYL